MADRSDPTRMSARLRQVKAGGFTVTEGTHPRGAELPWRDHDTPTLCFVLRGAFTEEWRGGSIFCRDSMLKITPAGERHRNQFSYADVRGLLIEADSALVASLRPEITVLDERLSFSDVLLAGLGRRIHQELLRPDSATALAVEGLLLELIATASRVREPRGGLGQPSWLTEVRERIHAGVLDRPGLAGLAATVGVHPVTLSRAFRRAFGCTVGEYVRRLRIERATQELTGTDLPLAEIAIRAGFSDQSHFSNLFRRHTGISPSRFRQAARSA